MFTLFFCVYRFITLFNRLFSRTSFIFAKTFIEIRELIFLRNVSYSFISKLVSLLMGHQVCIFNQELSLILWTYFTILCNPANGAGYVINTSLMPNYLENIYALLWIFARNRPSMVKRRSDKTKGSREKQSNFNTQKTKKLRTDLFILNACIIIINSNKQNDFLSILKAVNVTKHFNP